MCYSYCLQNEKSFFDLLLCIKQKTKKLVFFNFLKNIYLGVLKMSKKENNNNHANQQNANKGDKGVNKQYANKHGNRGKQMNPNHIKKGGKK